MKVNLRVSTKALLADLQTPISIYLKIRDLFPESVLMESSDFHGGEDSFSFIGFNPLARFMVREGIVLKEYPNGKAEKLEVSDETMIAHSFSEFIQCFHLEGKNISGINGFLGYTSYDMVSSFKNGFEFSDFPKITNIPSLLYILYRFIIVVNHLKNELIIVENVPEGEVSELDDLEVILRNNNISIYYFERSGSQHSEVSDDHYVSMLSSGVDNCKKEKVSQLVLSRCFSQDFLGDEFNVYRTLRSINPSPYLFYFDFGSFRIFGSSLETHCRVKKGRICMEPIANSYFRTGDDQRDQELIELLGKEDAEDIAYRGLVEALYNQLKSVCEDVHIDFYKKMQFYSHAIHLVSRISGKIREGMSSFNLFTSIFPASTLSGFPKSDAVRLISEIEPFGRGIYGGSIGYIGFDGGLNQAIMVRSFLSQHNVLYYQSGVNVTAETNPKEAVLEAQVKLDALRLAIEKASVLNV